LLGANVAGIAARGRSGDAVDRDLCARGPDPPVRVHEQTVQGVGAKVALSVLGTLKPADLASAIAMRDKAMVARTPGVGPKVAERIVTELKDKAPAYTDIDPALVRLSGALDEKRAPQPITDAVSALVNLGYAQPQAAAAIAAASRSAGDGAEVKTLIRLGLKELAK
jgi:Holliday junction DNA helicase RuvA